MSMVRSMVFFINVKLIFLSDVLVCVVYLRNKSPYHSLEDKTRLELWYDQLSLVRHLRVFGSICYALIPEEQRDMLGARSRKCILFGYLDTSKAYCLYDEVNKKFIVSRDVIFLETNKK